MSVAPHFYPILSKFAISRQNFVKLPNTKFHKNPSSASRANIWEQTITKLICFLSFFRRMHLKILFYCRYVSRYKSEVIKICNPFILLPREKLIVPQKIKNLRTYVLYSDDATFISVTSNAKKISFLCTEQPATGF